MSSRSSSSMTLPRLISAVEETVQRSRIGPPIRTVVSLVQTPRWRRRGSPPPAPPHVKRRILADYVERSGHRTFVETGYRGDTVANIRPLVEQVASIELDPTLHQYARRRFRHHPSVEILKGESAKVLPSVVASLSEPAVFWLDGHFSGGSTADPGVSPVLAELESILASDLPHVVLVDDARLFDGTDGYPTLDTIVATIRSRRPHLTCDVKDDIVRIHDRAGS